MRVNTTPISARDAIPSPPRFAAETADDVAERIRHIAGVGMIWWHGDGPFVACARHCGENRTATAGSLIEALSQVESEIRATNRAILREAARLV